MLQNSSLQSQNRPTTGEDINNFRNINYWLSRSIYYERNHNLVQPRRRRKSLRFFSLNKVKMPFSNCIRKMTARNNEETQNDLIINITIWT